MKERKKLLMKAVLLGLAATSAVIATLGVGFCGGFAYRKGNLVRADMVNSYREEELEKVQEKFDSGEISQSEFDVRVSYINGLQNNTIINDIVWNNNPEHQYCCKVKYDQSVAYDGAGLGMILGFFGGAFGTTALVCATKNASEEYREYGQKKFWQIKQNERGGK